MIVDATSRMTSVRCDNCDRQITIKTTRQLEAFSDTWQEGLTYDICPDCQNKEASDSDFSLKPEVQKKIETERLVREQIKAEECPDCLAKQKRIEQLEQLVMRMAESADFFITKI